MCKNLQVAQLLDKLQDQSIVLPSPHEDSQPANMKNVYCPRHMDKIIEYFCKQCTGVVCVKCIFDEHNGHDLVQIEEMANSLK
jgi:hypothetical protein